MALCFARAVRAQPMASCRRRDPRPDRPHDTVLLRLPERVHLAIRRVRNGGRRLLIESCRALGSFDWYLSRASQVRTMAFSA